MVTNLYLFVSLLNLFSLQFRVFEDPQAICQYHEERPDSRYQRNTLLFKITHAPDADPALSISQVKCTTRPIPPVQYEIVEEDHAL